MVLRLAEITLIEAVVSTQVLVEAERNLAAKLPAALPVFQTLAQRCLHVVSDPPVEAMTPYHGIADPKDVPLLVAARRERCRYLVTFNVRDYQPGLSGTQVLRPGELVDRVREWLAFLEG